MKLTSSDVIKWAKPRLYHLLSPLVALLLVLVFEQTRVSLMAEFLTVKLRYTARAPFDPPADPQLLFVGIDELSLAQFGKFPWPRRVEANFLQTLAQADKPPHTVAFDILFTEDTDKIQALREAADKKAADEEREADEKKQGPKKKQPVENSPSAPALPVDPSDDQKLADAAGLLPSVITGALSVPLNGQKNVDEQSKQRTLEQLAEAGLTSPLKHIHGDVKKIFGSDIADLPVKPLLTQSLFAFVNDDPSPIDDIRHTIPLVVRVRDQVFPSLALQTLCQMLNVDADKVDVDLPGQRIRLENSSGKQWDIPISKTGQFTINYRNANTFSTVGLFALMQNQLAHERDNKQPVNPACEVGNKILFVGQDATGLADMGPTPVGPRSPLSLVHLNVINNVLKNDYLRFVPWYWILLGWALITWPTVLRLKTAPIGEGIVAPTIIMGIYIAFAFALFWVANIQLPMVWPITSYAAINFGAIVLRWREERSGREEMKTLFSRMLSKEVMNHLMHHPSNLKLGGTERVATILFSDIRDYTKFSEGLSAEEVVRQLNLYFERMVPCVQKTKGTLHKYIGDAIMAAWGDIGATSQGTSKDALNAVRCGLMMRQRLKELNAEREADGLGPLRIGIGLNQGSVLAGLIGASSRSEFTVIGDAVNTASRLEGITKEFKTDFVISDSVRHYLDDTFLVRRLGFIQLKGKSRATVVHEVLGMKGSEAEFRMQPEDVAQYEKSFSCFLARRFAEAETGFAICAEKYPDDFCSRNYREASREFASQPPPDDWDGRIVMKTK